jgi:hypothetical protein
MLTKLGWVARLNRLRGFIRRGQLLALIDVTNCNGSRLKAFVLSLVVLLAIGVPGHAITINPTFDSSITSDPNGATIESTIDAAIGILDQTVLDPITVAIKFQETASGLSRSNWYFESVSYTGYLSALSSHATSSNDTTALAHLPAGPDNPVNGSTLVNLQLANARALGYNANPPTGQPDGIISLNTSLMNLSRTSVNPSKYDLMALATHEIDEVLGIASALTGSANGGPTPTGAIWPLDLFRYSQSGARSFDTGLSTNAYFSLDGTTQLVQFNQHAGGDFSDWFSYPNGGTPPRVQDAYATPGAMPNLEVEVTALDVIGFHTEALPGDLNRDGIVNAEDLALIASNWLDKGSNLADANGDGIVNAQDIEVIASNWLHTYGGSGAGSSASVPEPAGVFLATVGLLAFASSYGFYKVGITKT